MNLELLFTNIGFCISLLVSLCLGVLVFVRRPPKSNIDSNVNIVFSFLILFFSIWQISYVIGINIHDANVSRIAFMFNLATLFIGILNVHLIVAITGKYQKRKHVLWTLYSIASCIVVYFVIFPNSLLEPSQPELYLPNFFVPGPLYPLQDGFFFCITFYLLYQLFSAYHSADFRMRNRLKYFIVGVLYVYSVSLVPEFLLYGIPVDPLITAVVGLYAIPVAYAILKYDVIDIRVVAKQALGYTAAITAVTLFIILIGYANDTIIASIPDMPFWLLPLLSAIIAVMASVFVWRKLKEVDILKYDFVEVISHKFRTPLTRIRWSLDNLREDKTREEREHAVTAITEASDRLVELTTMLVGLSTADAGQFLYAFSKEDVSSILKETLLAVAVQTEEKGVTIDASVPPSTPAILVDRSKIQFVFQMILENAIMYSSKGGRIVIKTESKKSSVILSVQDLGIGISKDDQNRIFSKFFRSKNALLAHTEGLGIGLYLSKTIAKNNGGDLWAESEGTGKGSTFFLKMPLAR